MKNTPLRKERLRRGWTQQQLADFAQIGLSTVERAERGEPIRVDSIQRICACLDRQPEQLGLFVEPAVIERQKEPASPSINSAAVAPLSIEHAAIHYLRRQQSRLLDALAPGSTNLWVRDIVGSGGLFIPLPWEMVQGASASTNLVDYVIDALMAGERLLLLGEAGQGKTTLLKQVFTLMAERFLIEPGGEGPLPVYIPLREFSSFTGNAIELLWAHVGDELPLSFEEFALLARNGRIVFLFDGFDEIAGELTQRSINERAASKLFARPSILSCRKSFFDFYLSMSPLTEYYPRWVLLQPLTMTRAVVRYIVAFCQQKQDRAIQKRIADPETITTFILSSQELQELAQTPLFLIMMLDIFTDPKEMNEADWSGARLYSKYIEKWLKNEAAKPDSVLKWHEKLMLLQEFAWYVFTTKTSAASPSELSQRAAFTLGDLSYFIKHVGMRSPHFTEAQLLDDLCFRTLLTVSEGENYYFLHKSFQEYFVARYIFERLHTGGPNAEVVDTVGKVLQGVLPFEVVSFLKEMLSSRDLPLQEKRTIVVNLIEVFGQHQGDDPKAITIRQQTSHYLACLGTQQAIQFLEQSWEQEPNKWVQRGMMVGLALYCERADILDRYIRIVKEDPEAASINLGYHLVYYGDQVAGDSYYDLGGEQYEGTIKSIFRHLKSERHKNSWALDLLTLSTLLERRGKTALSLNDEYIPLLKEFLRKDHHGQNDIFQQEIKRLETILERENILK